jgi:putative DNA-invertase from lambdoid prophage Rac
MTVYGITRASTRKQQASPEVQAEMIRKHCATVQLPEPTILDEPLGTSGRSTDFRNRPQGRWLLLHAQPGDVLVVTKLDRLGRTARDILDTLEQFAKRNVRVIVIQFLGGQVIDMDSTVGRLVVIFFAGLAQFEADMIGERTSETLQWRRKQGLACNRAGFGGRKVGKRSEWDMQQLAYIAEIAERLGKGEDVVLVVADFWGRGIKDHRGLLWGQVQHKNGDGDENGKGNPFEHYWRATRWFHRMKHVGKLHPAAHCGEIRGPGWAIWREWLIAIADACPATIHYSRECRRRRAPLRWYLMVLRRAQGDLTQVVWVIWDRANCSFFVSLGELRKVCRLSVLRRKCRCAPIARGIESSSRTIARQLKDNAK